MKKLKIWKILMIVMMAVGMMTMLTGCPSDSTGGTTTDTDESENEILDTLEDMDFCISSGVGGWMGVLTFGENGSFTGRYIDSDYDETEEIEYNGVFSGVKKVGENEYSMELHSLEYEGSDEPPYLEVTEYSLYCPGTSVSSLPEGASDWMLMEESGGTLDNYCLLYFDSSYGDVNPYYSTDLSEFLGDSSSTSSGSTSSSGNSATSGKTDSSGTSGSSKTSDSSETSTAKTLSESEILKLIYDYAIKNQHYEEENGLYYHRSLEDTYMEIDDGDTCLVGVMITTYESPDFDEDTAFDSATDGYWYNKKTGEIKYIGAYQDDPKYFVNMETGERKDY